VAAIIEADQAFSSRLRKRISIAASLSPQALCRELEKAAFSNTDKDEVMISKIRRLNISVAQFLLVFIALRLQIVE